MEDYRKFEIILDCGILSNIISEDGRVDKMNVKYSVHNTTKGQRTRIVEKADAITSLGLNKSNPEDQQFFDAYIDGKMEINEILEAAIKKYTVNESNPM